MRPAARAAHGQTINDPRLIRGSADKEAEDKVSAAAVNLAQIDASKGIPVGAKVNASGVTTATNAQVSGSVEAGGSKRSIEAGTELSGAISGTGFTTITNQETTVDISCSGGNGLDSPGNDETSIAGPPLAGTAVVCASSLAAYVGACTNSIDHEYSNLVSPSLVGVSARGRRSFLLLHYAKIFCIARANMRAKREYHVQIVSVTRRGR